MISSSNTSVPHLGFGGARSLIGALICTALLFFAAPAYAISDTVCAAEQEAFIKASIDNEISPETRRLSGMEAHIRKRENETRTFLMSDENDAIGWHIKDTLNIKTERDAAEVVATFNRMAQKYDAEQAQFNSNPYRGLTDTRFSPYFYKMMAARSRMKACHFEARRRELGGSADTTVAASPSKDESKLPEAPTECSAKNTESANAALNHIEERLGVFLDSPQGRSTAASTPVLRVIIWATSEMSKTIERYCPNTPAYADRLSELKASHDAALAACIGVQSYNPDCTPVAP